ncbi:hypothetical protein [Anaerobacillus sp. 1_MG-2023]|nr:hypothetical protein [Anaerobacillus sp. 1_MG-2023]MDO6657459.1 hypothetical protein [Anaerobacillus sp. 1_MG-2023]
MNLEWITPEEIKAKKDRNKRVGYALIPVGAIFIGAVIAFASQLA